MDSDKKKIITLFNKNVRGKKSETSEINIKHAGKEGHWLEKQMGIAQNASNSPDLLGYEMKNDTTSKTTFGDWSADYYIFNKSEFDINKDRFLTIFGKPNKKKNNRYSWSGEPVPKINHYNSFGQKLFVDDRDNVIAEYNYEADQRPNKKNIVPDILKQNNLVLASWREESIKAKLENKFNQKGWFKCLKNKDNIYDQIVFGAPINFHTWIMNVKDGTVFFDSGMYQGNARNYSQWRANNSYWEKLVTSKY